MKVIFLDIDGVLNYVYCTAKAPNGCIGIATEPLEVLSDLIRASDAQIVLISTWKKAWEKVSSDCSSMGEYLNMRLAQQGLTVLDKTRDHILDRGYGIQVWLEEHPDVTQWLVLDDDIFEDYEEEGILSHLVTTNFYTGGLRKEHLPLCMEILTKEEEYSDGNQN